MKQSNPYRNERLVHSLAESINQRVEKLGPLKLMHVCGSHERTVAEWGIRSLLKPELELISGPGCPVCVCAEHEIGEVIEIAKKGVTIVSFGDMIKVKTGYGSLIEARADGADVRVVYSPFDAVTLAKKEPEKEFVFLAVGFETTTAPIAAIFAEDLPDNFSLLTSLKLTSPAVETLLLTGEATELKGIVAPGHVSIIVGSKDWERFPEKYNLSVTVAGFEPVDFLVGVDMLLESLEKEENKLKNGYGRLVKYGGNVSAQKWIDQVLEPKKAFWRALGWVENSGLFLREAYSAFDARKKYGVDFSSQAESTIPKGCICHKVVLGKAYPTDCALYGKRCNLMEPVGPCMVSEEGTCHIWQQFGENYNVKTSCLSAK